MTGIRLDLATLSSDAFFAEPFEPFPIPRAHAYARSGRRRGQLPLPALLRPR